MTNSQVGFQVAIGSFSWEIPGINSLCFHLKKPNKKTPKPWKTLSFNTVKLKKWSKSHLAPSPSFLQSRPLPLSLLKAVPNCSSMIWLRSFSGLQPLIQICGKHQPAMNSISFTLLLLGSCTGDMPGGLYRGMLTCRHQREAKEQRPCSSSSLWSSQVAETLPYHGADCVPSKVLPRGFFNHLPELHGSDGVRSLSCRLAPSAETRVPCARQWDAAAWRAQA